MNKPSKWYFSDITAVTDRLRQAWLRRVRLQNMHKPARFSTMWASLTVALTLACPAPAPATETGSGSTHLEGRSHYIAPRAALAPRVDGIPDDTAWNDAGWQEMNHRWLGPDYEAEDFSGRYKVVWFDDRLYILVQIIDDVLFDAHRDPLQRYWDDDCLEIFLDENYSGGEHQYNHNAFAYHVSLDNRAVDIGTDREPHDYSHHVESQWKQYAEGVTWELALNVYADDYQDSGSDTPVDLYSGKILGLMLAYCDNDGSELRENFIGSESVPVGSKDRGWIDAGLFGRLELGPENQTGN